MEASRVGLGSWMISELWNLLAFAHDRSDLISSFESEDQSFETDKA